MAGHAHTPPSEDTNDEEGIDFVKLDESLHDLPSALVVTNIPAAVFSDAGGERVSHDSESNL